METDISNTDDVIDIRDVIARVEALTESADDLDTLGALLKLLDECRGNGGDEQWHGDWYPVTLIRDSYFTDYTIELLQDIGDLPKDIPGYIAIDWEQTAKNIQIDYTQVDFDGVTYWTR